MRKPIILFLMLCCFTQCCSGSEKDQEALEEGKESVEPNSDLNNDVMKTVKEKIKHLSFLDLCFAKLEFLELIKNDSSFRDTWKIKVADIRAPQKDYLNIQNQHFEYFNDFYSKKQTNGYSEQVAFLIKNRPEAIGKNYLSESEYGLMVAKYSKTDNYIIYNTIFDLLVVDAKNFLNEIDKNQEAKSGFHKWLTDIGENGIQPISIAPYEVLKRKRDYTVSLLEKIENPLAQKAIKVLKSAVIRPID